MADALFRLALLLPSCSPLLPPVVASRLPRLSTRSSFLAIDVTAASQQRQRSSGFVDSKDLQKFNQFGSKETQGNANLKQAGTSNAPIPYIPDKLFEDLIDLRNSDGSIKSKNASTMWGFSGQGMISCKS